MSATTLSIQKEKILASILKFSYKQLLFFKWYQNPIILDLTFITAFFF